MATLTVRSGREAYVRRILGLAENEALPAAFTTKIDITDNIQLNRTSMTIVVGQKEQLSVKLIVFIPVPLHGRAVTRTMYR